MIASSSASSAPSFSALEEPSGAAYQGLSPSLASWRDVAQHGRYLSGAEYGGQLILKRAQRAAPPVRWNAEDFAVLADSLWLCGTICASSGAKLLDVIQF